MKRYLLPVLTVGAMLGVASCDNSAKQGDTEMKEQTAQVEAPAEKSVVIEATQTAIDSLLSISPSGEVKAVGNRPVVIDFNATWCGPCKQFAPAFHAVAAGMADRAVFLSVDVDKNPRLSEAFGITAIPNVSVVFPDGTVDTHVGYMSESEFKRVLTRSLEKDK